MMGILRTRLIKRLKTKKRFKEEKKILLEPDLRQISREEIESHVKESMEALKDLLSSNTIDMERQPNSEN